MKMMMFSCSNVKLRSESSNTVIIIDIKPGNLGELTKL